MTRRPPKSPLFPSTPLFRSFSSGLDPVAPPQPEETMYIPAAQVDGPLLALLHVWLQPNWMVRTTGAVAGLTGEMQRALEKADPKLPASGFYTMGGLLARKRGNRSEEQTAELQSRLQIVFPLLL